MVALLILEIEHSNTDHGRPLVFNLTAKTGDRDVFLSSENIFLSIPKFWNFILVSRGVSQTVNLLITQMLGVRGDQNREMSRLVGFAW